MLILRDMIESDIEDYVRWFTAETEWMRWDAPWEKDQTDEETERANWSEYYRTVSQKPADRIRYKFEIEADGRHIGWVSAYTDTEFYDNPEETVAIGIDIPETRYRGNGNGSRALTQFMDYYRKLGHKRLLTQTWSGNLPMIAVAKKLGFTEVSRAVGVRTVNGKAYDALTFEILL